MLRLKVKSNCGSLKGSVFVPRAITVMSWMTLNDLIKGYLGLFLNINELTGLGEESEGFLNFQSVSDLLKGNKVLGSDWVLNCLKVLVIHHDNERFS
jgi:hypothetical protein